MIGWLARRALLIGLDIGPDVVRAVEGDRATIRSLGQEPVAGDDPAAALGVLLARATGRRVAASGLESVFRRTFESPPGRVPAAAEVAVHVPFPLEDVAWTVLPGPRDGLFEIVAPRREAVDRLRALLGRVGFRAIAIEDADEAVVRAYRHRPPDDRRRVVSIVRLEGRTSRIHVLVDGRPHYVRTRGETFARPDELARGVAVYHARHAANDPDNPVEEVLLCGEGAAGGDVAGVLRETLGLPVRPWNPAPELGPEGLAQVVAVGLALRRMPAERRSPAPWLR